MRTVQVCRLASRALFDGSVHRVPALGGAERLACAEARPLPETVCVRHRRPRRTASKAFESTPNVIHALLHGMRHPLHFLCVQLWRDVEEVDTAVIIRALLESAGQECHAPDGDDNNDAQVYE